MSGFGDPGQAWDSLVPESQRFSSMDAIGWWELEDDITEYNRENEKLGMRAVINTGQTPNGPFAYFELQHNLAILTQGLFTDSEWKAKERCPLEFFVMTGYFDYSKKMWVTRSLKAFVVGIPSPFIWRPCAEPEAYSKRVPGTISMVIADNDPPADTRGK